MSRRQPKGLRVRLEGVQHTVRDLAKVDRRIHGVVLGIVRKHAQKTYDEARRLAPRDSGTLYHSIYRRVYKKDLASIVGTRGLQYSVPVNFGFDLRYQYLFPRKQKRRFSTNVRRGIRNFLKSEKII